MTPRVYLAGPIKGLSFGDATDWRGAVARWLAPEIAAYSPMRSKDHLDTGERLGDFYDNDILANPRAIVARDHNDCRNADLVIAYLSGAEAVSVGTMFELAWCHAYRVPLVVVDDGSTGTHRHPFVHEAADWFVMNLEQAVYVARSVLLP
jgi:nucleoside 2-deoxyribosyltransferase